MVLFLLVQNIFNKEEPKLKKLSVLGLNMILAVHLEGTIFFEELLVKVKLDVDEQNNIKDHVIDNIKGVLKVALRFAVEQDFAIAHELKNALNSLLDYGTEGSSQNLRLFLKSVESKSPNILVPGKVGVSNESIGRLFCRVTEAAITDQILINDFNLILNHVVQSFPE